MKYWDHVQEVLHRYVYNHFQMTINDLKKELRNWKFTRKRATHLTIGVSAMVIYEFFARPMYRPYIYRNHINDFHIADTLGNSLGTVATIFILIGFIGQERTQHLFLIKTITIAVAVYEIAHPLLGKPIDPWDIAATIITGVLCLIGYKLIHPVRVRKIRVPEHQR